jgi:hypothetical protein
MMKRVLVVIVWLLLLAPLKVLAGLTEYAIILALIAIIAIAALILPPGSKEVIDQLHSSIVAAQAANSSGIQRRELSSLSKAIGTAQALMGMTASCDACGEVRTDLQAIIGLATKLRARLLKPSGGCNPDGVIESGEICDPLASPTGCPITSIPTFCDDTCDCEAIATTTTTTTSSTTSTTCPAGETPCAGTCVDTSADPSNCGSCGNVCPPANPACIGGVCTIP